MTKPKFALSILFSLLALSIGIYFGLAKSPGSIDGSQSAANPNTDVVADPKASKSMPGVSSAKKTIDNTDPFQMVRDGKSVTQALDEAIALRGKHDAQVYSLFKSAWLLCRGDYDPKGAMSASSPDVTRLWAIDRLSKACEGFNPSKYQYERKDMFDSTLYKKDPRQAIALANQHIQSSVEQQEIYESGVMLIENGDFPLASALPSYRDYGTADLIMPWVRATSMLACSEGGGCDDYSLQTLSYCAINGCAAGSNLDSAYQRNLSPREYSATMAFYGWLRLRRK